MKQEEITMFSNDGKAIVSTARFGGNTIIGDVTLETSVGIPAWILTHPAISDRAVRLWAYLKAAVLGTVEIPGTTHRALADVLAVSERTVRTAIYELRDVGAITICEAFSDNAQVGNLYYLWPMTPGGWQPVATGGGSQLPADISISKDIKDTALISAKPKKRVKKTYDEQFLELWKLYPRHVNKAGAFKAYGALYKRGVSHEDLKAAVINYAKDRQGQPETYTMYASTFFGPNDRWADYLPGKTTELLQMNPEDKMAAAIWDDYDAGVPWRHPEGHSINDNPLKWGIARPVNSQGQLVDSNGVPFELDNSGQRRNVGYWN